MTEFISQFADRVAEWKRQAAAGSSSAAINAQYYGPGGTGYQDEFRDWQLQQAAQTAPSLGITPAQLVTNPGLATDPVALAKYKGISDTPSLKATPTYQEYNPATGQTTYPQQPGGTPTNQVSNVPQNTPGQTNATITNPTQPTQASGIPSTQLQPGATGDEVKKLQDYLVANGYMTQEEVDTGYGTYGPKTTKAVIKLQNDLKVDNSTGPGYFGPRTIAALGGQTSPTGQGGVSGSNTTGGSTTGGTTGGTTGTDAATDIYTKYGIDALVKDWQNSPVKSYEEVFKDVLNSLGYQDAKTKLDEATKAYNEAMGGVNENPWISEAGRVGKLAKLQDKYFPIITLLENQLNRAREDAESAATRAINTMQQNRQYQKEELDFYMQRAEAEVSAQAKASEADIKFRYQTYPDYLKTMSDISSGATKDALDAELKRLQIEKAKIDISGVSPDSSNVVIQKQNDIAVLQDKVNTIDNLIKSKGLNAAVGTIPLLGRPAFSIANITGEKQNFIAGVQQLVSKDTLDTLINLKKAGGTLGALSDQERIMLQSAASKIGTWAVKDKNSNVVGYNTSATYFKQELENIKKLTQRALNAVNGDSYLDVVDQALQSSTNYYSTYLK